MPIMNLDLKRNNLHTGFFILIAVSFIVLVGYNIIKKPYDSVSKKELVINIIGKAQESKKIEGIGGKSSGSSIKNGILYDYWKITDKNDKIYTIPKENTGLYDKIEINKSCFVSVNTDIIPNVILDVKYCN